MPRPGSPTAATPTTDRRRPRARRSSAVALVAVVALATACGSSGRELREVPADQTAPPRSTVAPAPPAPSSAADDDTVAGLALLADGWTAGSELPVASSCDGDGLSPPLSIVGTPATATELALVVTDPDAAGFVHWIVTGMAPVDVTLPAGALPPGVQGPNTSGGNGWFPLCPPPGEVHLYELEVLAFDAPPTVAGAVGPEAIVEALRGQASTRALLTGTFQR